MSFGPQDESNDTHTSMKNHIIPNWLSADVIVTYHSPANSVCEEGGYGRASDQHHEVKNAMQPGVYYIVNLQNKYEDV